MAGALGDSTGIRGRTRWLWIGIAALVGYSADQLSKAWALASLDPNDPPELFGGLISLRVTFNPGAAFGMGAGATVLFSCLALVLLVALLVWLAPKVQSRFGALAVGLLIAGDAGNLTDRLLRAPGPLRGHVVDFIAVPYFAVCNVADICLTCGAILLGIYIIFLAPPSQPTAAAVAAAGVPASAAEPAPDEGSSAAVEPPRADTSSAGADGADVSVPS